MKKDFFYVDRIGFDDITFVSCSKIEGNTPTGVDSDFNMDKCIDLYNNQMVFIDQKKLYIYVYVTTDTYKVIEIKDDIQLTKVMKENNIEEKFYNLLSEGTRYIVNDKLTLYYQSTYQNCCIMKLYAIEYLNNIYGVSSCSYKQLTRYIKEIIYTTIEEQLHEFDTENINNHNIYEENYALKETPKYSNIYSYVYRYSNNDFDSYLERLSISITYNNIIRGIVNIQLNHVSLEYDLINKKFNKNLLSCVFNRQENIYISNMQYNKNTCPEMFKKIMDFLKFLSTMKSYTIVLSDTSELKVSNIYNFKLFYIYPDIKEIKYKRKVYKIDEEIKKIVLENKPD